MAEAMSMPKLGFHMSEGEPGKWHKKVGESVKNGAPAEKETAPAAEAASASAWKQADDAGTYDYDLVVIGAGPGGYETAIKAAQMGKKTCIVEEKYLGGTCLNEGCIPTKTLIASAERLSAVKEAALFGVEGVDVSRVRVNMETLQGRKNQVVKTLVSGVELLLKGNGVSMENGTARFVDAHTIQVNGKRITAAYFVIATGSSAWIPPFLTVEGENNLLTSKEALALNEVPESIAIIGGGVIGVEFAFLLNRLGARVTVLELMDHILPMVDPEISELARKRLEKDGIAFKLGAKVSAVRNNTVHYEFNGCEESVQARYVLMCVGRVANTEGLNAEGIGLEFMKKSIKTDDRLRTNIPNIYAIGDVNGKVMLAHTASHEGMVAVDNILGGNQTIHYDQIPSCVYTNPEIACIGLTEEMARRACRKVKVGRFNLSGNGKSLAEGDTSGRFKVILDGDTGEILGVHLYGPHVTDMIGEVAAAMANELTAEEIIRTVHPHPTVNEALGEAFMAAWNGRPINGL